MVWDDGRQLQGGRYLLKQVLGQSGFGITYRALHVQRHETVVIKAPNFQLKDDPQYPKYIQRFNKEAEQILQMGNLFHLHLAEIYDLFREEEDIPCLVLSFVQGESLFALIQRKGALSVAKAVKYITQIGEGLSLLHENGLTHRAAYPKNIIINPFGQAILVNYGLASEIVPTEASFQFLAHPAFVAYEEFAGNKEPTVDVYSLAASLYYAVTAQFPASPLEQMNGHPLIAPKVHNSLLDDALNDAILQGMALDAKKRPQTLKEWLELLKVPVTKTPQTSHNVAVPLIVTPKKWQQERQTDQKQNTYLPWVWLLGIPLSLEVLGYFCAIWPWSQVLATVGATLGSWLVVRFGADAGALAGALAAVISWIVAMVGALLLSNTDKGGMIVAIAIVMSGIGAWFVSLAGSVDQLLKVFTRLQTLLILSGLSWLGIGLGWLLYQRFQLSFL